MFKNEEYSSHASFLGEPGGADPLRPARRSIYPLMGDTADTKLHEPI